MSDDSSNEDTETDSSTEDEELMTELDRYLKTPRVKKLKDPLQWWIDNIASYPRLSRMARDFLVIPGEFFFLIFNSVFIIHKSSFSFLRCCRKSF
jgi:hypothetical protein